MSVEYVEISENSKIACTKKGNQYSYSFVDGDDEFTKLHKKQPIEHSKNSEIGKAIFNLISADPISATSEDERKQKYLKKFNTVLQNLQDILSRQKIQESEVAKKEATLEKEQYENYFEEFKFEMERYGYTPLEYIIRVFEGYGVDSQLEILKIYLGYLQTLIGLKGTNVITVGQQSSGKSHLLENPLDCLPQRYVHKGIYSKPAFFTEFAGMDLTHHLFYLGDLGGDNDDENTIELRNTLKQLSTDGFVSRSLKDEGEVIHEEITGYPAIVYSTVHEDMINEQEKSRSIVISPPNVNQHLLMIFDSFNEAPAGDYELKLAIDKTKKILQGYSCYLMREFQNVEMFNPYMFAVQEYLTNMSDFNRKIKEFNMLLKIVCVLDRGFCLEHDLYFDPESEESITTKLMIASKKDVINALNLFEGSTGLLPTEVALLKGLLDNYICYPEIEYDESFDISFEEAVLEYNHVDNSDVRAGQETWVDLEFVEDITDKGTKFYIKNWNHGYKVYDEDANDYVDKYCWFSVVQLKSVFRNNRWIRNIKDKLSEKLMKLYDFGMLIKIGKTDGGANVYGINYGVHERLYDLEPHWNKKSIDQGVTEFHRKYPTLIDEFDEFITVDRQKRIKNTSMEITINDLYDLPWRRIV